MNKRNNGTPTRQDKLLDLQLFRVRKAAHAQAKIAAAAAGRSLEEWASDALEREARRQLARSR